MFFSVFVAHFGLLGEAGENFIHATVKIAPRWLTAMAMEAGRPPKIGVGRRW